MAESIILKWATGASCLLAFWLALSTQLWLSRLQLLLRHSRLFWSCVQYSKVADIPQDSQMLERGRAKRGKDKGWKDNMGTGNLSVMKKTASGNSHTQLDWGSKYIALWIRREIKVYLICFLMHVIVHFWLINPYMFSQSFSLFKPIQSTADE